MKTDKRIRFEELYPLIMDTIREGNQFSFHAFGRSMLPYIKNGTDLVTLAPVDSLQPYDILFYRRKSGQFVLHRLLRLEKDGSLTLCGDNQYGLERDISPDQVIAKLVKIERNGKSIPLSDLRTKLWCALLLPIKRFFLRLRAAIGFCVKRILVK